MPEVDPRFRQMGKGARRRRWRVRALRGGLALALGGVLIAGLWSARGDRLWGLAPGPDAGGGAATDAAGAVQMIQVGAQFDIAPRVSGDTFTDIPGDPLIVPAPDQVGGEGARRLSAPAELTASGRFGPPTQPLRLALLDSALMPRDRRILAALPSTREEFALFQAERSRGGLRATTGAAAPGIAAQTSAAILFLRNAEQRRPLWRDTILETVRPTPIQTLLRQNGFDPGTAAQIDERLRTSLGLGADLAPGTVLALRWRGGTNGGDGARAVIQLSVYGAQGYLGSLALSAAGRLVPAADPWIEQPLMQDAMAGTDAAAPEQQRLLDAIYSAALRNDVPAPIIGEAMALMAQVFDLDSFADPEDRLSLIYTDPGAQGATQGTAQSASGGGQILFVGIDGPAGARRCYVVPGPQGDVCHAPGARVRRAAAGGFVQPVAGVLSGRFVPPVADEARAVQPDAQPGGKDARGQVVWTVPQQSPVMAVADGRVTARSDTMVEITHAGDLTSRYLSLGQVSDTVTVGAPVARGAIIGRVGLLAGGAEPGLAFQILRGGKPVDPLPLLGGGTEVLASDQIEALIGHIIRVESGGDAAAKNPRSTATGLGQFIESTWLRMMRSYRPDLVAGLAPRDLLDLRRDPALSRQMVRHLAQENEAYLRARGHQITAGRLYLAHFLGPAGADMALRADAGQSVESVMGAAVIAANPFLRPWSIADLRAWAERRMAGPSGADPGADPGYETVPEQPLSPALREFVAQMDRLRRDTQG